MGKKGKNKFLERITDLIGTVEFYICDTYLSIRAWFRHCFNKTHFKFIKEAWCAYPWDWCYMYRVERAQLVDMIEYFKKGYITTEETYAEMIKWLNILIKLNDIILEANGVDLFDYEGQMIFEQLPNGKTYELKDNGLIYHSKVYANLKNAKRFCRNEHELKYVMGHPHELYKMKAKHLYHTIKERYLELMWD